MSVIISCSKEEIKIKQDNKQHELASENNLTNGVRKFKSKKELKDFIEKSTSTMLVNHSKIASFRSAEANVDETPEISFLVPDEKLRTVLNNQLEIIVADTVYKVTKEGTFYTNVSNISNLDKAIEKVSLFSTITPKLKKLDEAYLFDTHDLWNNTDQNNPITNPHFFDDNDDNDEYLTDDVEKEVTRSASSHRDITESDFESFETMGVVKPSLIGKVLEFIANKTSYKKIRFKNEKNRKLYVSFYNKDFVFYNSSGFDVKVMKKLWYGRWGRMVNWSCGVSAGFSNIVIEHTITPPKMEEMRNFFKDMKVQHIKTIEHIRLSDYYYKANKTDAVFYNDFPFKNNNGNSKYSIPLFVKELSEHDVQTLNKFVMKQLKTGFKSLKNLYNNKKPVQQYTAFSKENNEKYYDIHTNILYFNGGGYRLNDQFLKEHKSITIGFTINGGGINNPSFSIGKHDIIKSAIVEANGFVLTEDGDDFIGVRITVKKKH